MMFPTVNYDVQVEELTQQSTDTAIKNNFVFDYSQGKFIVIDGKPALNSGAEAIKQWIILFLNTELNGYGVYKNTLFGTNIRKLLGFKKLNNGYIEAEVERNIREGFLLCPDIEKVTSFNMSKSGRALIISVSILTYSGDSLGVNINVSSVQ